MNIEQYKEIIHKNLEKYFSEYSKNSSYSSKIWEAMAYTTLLGGKRLRAIMCLEIAKKFKADINLAMPIACAMEIMHAYSLIHDDLPCMDNDDLRRSKPTNHKVYGEATALLAGDALISFGAELIIEKLSGKIGSDIILNIVKDYLKCAGARGIIAGQLADIEAEGKKIDIDNLKYIHKYKTGALFECSLVSGARIGGADNEKIEKIRTYARNFGVLFQVYDDIIDCTLTTNELGKTAGKDADTNKMTYVSVYGLDEAKNIFYSLMKQNYDILSELNIESDVFCEIYEMLKSRIR